MFRPNAVDDHPAEGIRMRFARPSAFVLALLTAALIWTAVWHMTPEVSTEQLVVNGPVARLDHVSNAAPFRCDSLLAQDCFEMFHRHTTSAAVTTVPFMPVFDRRDLAAVGRADTDACLSNVFHRGDRCLMRDNR
jgi:hypothetical protein